MVTDQTDVDQGAKVTVRYFVDAGVAEESGRSLPLLLGSRRCYADQQADEELGGVKVKTIIARIAGHCGKESDYLPPDTPLKEAIFRVMLAGGNKPTTAEAISRILTDKWAMSPFPRDLSPRVIERLLTSSASYCIGQIVDLA